MQTKRIILTQEISILKNGEHKRKLKKLKRKLKKHKRLLKKHKRQLKVVGLNL